MKAFQIKTISSLIQRVNVNVNIRREQLWSVTKCLFYSHKLELELYFPLSYRVKRKEIAHRRIS